MNRSRPRLLGLLALSSSVLLVISAVVSIAAAYQAGNAYLHLAHGAGDKRDLELTGLLTILFLLSIPTGLLFTAWFYLTYKDLAHRGFRLSHSGSMAIWSWLIPVGNLFAPKQIANEIWRANTPLAIASADGGSEVWRRQPVARSVHAWWALWIFSQIGTTLALFLVAQHVALTRLSEAGVSTGLGIGSGEVQWGQLLLSASMLAQAVAALLLIGFIRHAGRPDQVEAFPHQIVPDVEGVDAATSGGQDASAPYGQ